MFTFLTNLPFTSVYAQSPKWSSFYYNFGYVAEGCGIPAKKRVNVHLQWLSCTQWYADNRSMHKMDETEESCGGTCSNKEKCEAYVRDHDVRIDTSCRHILEFVLFIIIHFCKKNGHLMTFWGWSSVHLLLSPLRADEWTHPHGSCRPLRIIQVPNNLRWSIANSCRHLLFR